MDDDTPQVDNFDIFRKCIEILPIAIYVFDFLDNRFIYTNRTFEAILGYSYTEVKKFPGLPLSDIFHTDDVSVLTESLIAIKSGKKQDIDITIRLLQKDGQYHWLRNRIVVFKHNSDGTTRQFLGVTEDISAIKKIELDRDKLLQEKQSLEDSVTAKDRCFSVISHEIRTPLNAIIGMVDLMEQNPDKSNITEFLDTLKFSSNNLQALVDDVLDYSKIQADKIEFKEVEFDIFSTLEHIRKLYATSAKDKGIGLHLHIDENVPNFIIGDPARLSQILNNLVSNALKFTEKGGVSISLNLHSQTKHSVTLVFKVADTGIGIPANQQKSIFEPYQQSKDINRQFGGIGLGLSIVKNLVDLQNGKIKLQSKVNKGSTFQVKLKFKKSEAEVQEVSSEKFLPALNLKILYVEDVIPNQLMMKGICSQWNVALDVVSNGEEALKIVQNKMYDLILMDIHMAGIDGYETSRKIRNMPERYFQQVPILAVSGSSPNMDKAKFKTAGMNNFILKPTDPDKFYKILKKYADKKANNEIKHKKSIASFQIQFSQLDDLYHNKAQDYQDLLKVIKNQFENDKALLIKAILEKDNAAVSTIRHRSMSILTTLGQQDFINFLREIKALESKNESEIRDIATHVFHHFDEILASIKQKFNSLQGQNSSVSS